MNKPKEDQLTQSWDLPALQQGRPASSSTLPGPVGAAHGMPWPPVELPVVRSYAPTGVVRRRRQFRHHSIMVALEIHGSLTSKATAWPWNISPEALRPGRMENAPRSVLASLGVAGIRRRGPLPCEREGRRQGIRAIITG